MAATILTPLTLVCTTSLASISSAVTSGKVRCVHVRAANVGSAAGNVDLVLTNGTTSIYRAKNYPVPYNDVNSSPDLESSLVIPAGWYLQAKASAGTTVEVSISGTEADAADFA